MFWLLIDFQAVFFNKVEMRALESETNYVTVLKQNEKTESP